MLTEKIRSVSRNLYSDRHDRGTPQTAQNLSSTTKDALLNFVRSRVEANWLAESFPEHCYDGNGITGSDRDAVVSYLGAVVPQIKWPLSVNRDASDDAVFDLLEVVAQKISLPKRAEWHGFFKHHELEFDGDAGKIDFRDAVNMILSGGGSAFAMDIRGEVQRIIPEEVVHSLDSLQVPTGDEVLDNLLAEAHRLYVSRRAADRYLALEKLWDGFERLKTIDGWTKSTGADRLAANVEPPELRDSVKAEMLELTRIGNQFQIRHHETDKIGVPVAAQDYLMRRMSAVIALLIEVRERSVG
ncbi:hypothetical protein ACRYG1_09480 [Mycobacteroides abscessus]